MKYLLISTAFVTCLIGGVGFGSAKSYASPASALNAMAHEDWSAAQSAVTAERDPVLNKIYEYMLYTDSQAYKGLPFDRIVAFIQSNPHWPDQDKLRRAAEMNITSSTPKEQILSFFAGRMPVSGAGIIVYAGLLSSDDQIRSMLERSWAEADMDTETQSRILESYGRFMSRDLHRRRLDELLFNDQVTQARQYAAQLQNGYPALVEARILLEKDSANAEQSLNNVPRELQSDTGLLFERLKWRRRNDMDSGAIQILNLQPETKFVTNKEEWWKERNIIIRRMIERRDYRTAYALAANHRAGEPADMADAEWMAGWLALRFLNDPARAVVHFNAMNSRVKTPISKSRAAYWLGRALEQAGKKDEATQWYNYASNFPTAYYGQLASKKLNINLRHPVSPQSSAQDVARIRNSDLGRAIRMFHDAGLDGLRNKFIKALTAQARTGGEYQALATMMRQMGLPQEALKVGKAAVANDVYLIENSYPDLSGYFAGLPIDKALGHGIIRQESQFDIGVKSPAGALGLMQLMPATARDTAAKLNIDHNVAWLTSNPKHNIRLGSAYLAQLIERFDGAYPMAIAAYNAGPSRVRQWIDQFGDPRTGAVDWVDWIELIPISETRNYVQRVSEGYNVYHDIIGIR